MRLKTNLKKVWMYVDFCVFYQSLNVYVIIHLGIKAICQEEDYSKFLFLLIDVAVQLHEVSTENSHTLSWKV